MSQTTNDIRGVLIQIDGGRLLLPNASIAEVMSYAPPEPIEGAPDWLLGRIRWRGWQLPLVSFSRVAGIAEDQGGLGSKVLVLKALGGDVKMPHFALLTQGFPRLITVSRSELMVDADNTDPLPDGVRVRVLLREDAALIPDVEHLEASISEALAA